MCHHDTIQHDADEYAATVLRYFKAASPDLPALRDPESTLYDTLQLWLDMHWGMPPTVRDAIAGAAVGHARERVPLDDLGDDVVLFVAGG
jgi:hypothetical protein